MYIDAANSFYAEIDLRKARKQPSRMSPFAHQTDALKKLSDWFGKTKPPRGGILTLPTGAGKTFTAVRFLCTGPLDQGYKVLWMAHTHHLLEQAFFAFVPITNEKGYEVGQIHGRNSLRIRVVSGTEGHSRVHQISKDDDIVISTWQSIKRAYADPKHTKLRDFLKSAKGNLVVVFDEAHHTPADGNRRFMLDLREDYPEMYFLGLTATPTYTDERKRGHLWRIYPQGIVHQALAQKLMADGILAKPVFKEPINTDFAPEIDEKRFREWVRTNRDIPEEIVSTLATNKKRNDYIVSAYIENQNDYGKTIIFADRWPQCEYISEALNKRGIKAGAIYSQTERGGTSDERNRQPRDHNAKVLNAFKDNELKVLLNIRMLTEGTDVPDVKTVFLTRQTRSEILFTQMVGRALRGPKVGGKDTANIVTFIDNWQGLVNWAGWEVSFGEIEETDIEIGKRGLVQFISIELLRRLSRQMDSGANISVGPYLSLMPVGWYRVRFEEVAEGDDVEPASDLIMVFDNEIDAYKTFIKDRFKSIEQLSSFEDTVFDPQEIEIVNHWKEKYFQDIERLSTSNLERNLYSITRHIAQYHKEPQFFAFEERDNHDLDKVAEEILNQDLKRSEEETFLNSEYNRADRFWRTFYPSYLQFKTQVDAVINKLACGSINEPPIHIDLIERSNNLEPSEELKAQVKARDSYRCLCCGEDNKRYLEIDHIAPKYYGGNNDIENLQTLCRTCNNHKGINELNFRYNRTNLSSPIEEMEYPKFIQPWDFSSPKDWERKIRRAINIFFKCSAVASVVIGQRGEKARNWKIELYAGNDAKWLKNYLKLLLKEINKKRRTAGFFEVDSITVETPGGKPVLIK